MPSLRSQDSLRSWVIISNWDQKGIPWLLDMWKQPLRCGECSSFLGDLNVCWCKFTPSIHSENDRNAKSDGYSNELHEVFAFEFDGNVDSKWVATDFVYGNRNCQAWRVRTKHWGWESQQLIATVPRVPPCHRAEVRYPTCVNNWTSTSGNWFQQATGHGTPCGSQGNLLGIWVVPRISKTSGLIQVSGEVRIVVVFYSWGYSLQSNDLVFVNAGFTLRPFYI